MRAAPAILSILALAACQVNVEGAPCAVPGTATDCPDGQACGNDGTCSKRAAACTAARTLCTPAATAEASPKRCAANRVETCTAADAVCGAWSMLGSNDDCGATSLVCDASAGAAACSCRALAAGETFAVDPAAVAAPGLAQNGAIQPPACRFTKLGDALVAAGARQTPTRIQAVARDGALPGTDVVFAGETLPLVVPSNVSIVGANSPAGKTIIWGDSAAPTPPIMELHGTLERVTIENVSMIGNGVDLVCESKTAAPTIRDAVISGTRNVGGSVFKLANGITTDTVCNALLERVEVSGVSGNALDILGSTIEPVVTVTASRLHDSGVGIRVSGARVVVQNEGATLTEVTKNTGNGIMVDAGGIVDVTLTGVLVKENQGTGVVLAGVPAASAFRMTGCDVHSNATGTPTQYGVSLKAGGVLLAPLLLPTQSLATFQMHGNRFHSNHGAQGADEIAFATGTGWVLDTGACTTANAVACLRTNYAVSIATTGTVDARHTTWPEGGAITNGFVNTSLECLPRWLAADCP